MINAKEANKEAISLRQAKQADPRSTALGADPRVSNREVRPFSPTRGEEARRGNRPDCPLHANLREPWDNARVGTLFLVWCMSPAAWLGRDISTVVVHFSHLIKEQASGKKAPENVSANAFLLFYCMYVLQHDTTVPMRRPPLVMFVHVMETSTTSPEGTV